MSDLKNKHVANVEVSRELFELSGWNDTNGLWEHGVSLSTTPLRPIYAKTVTPAYDLGYLVRKFVGKGGVELRYGDEGCFATSGVWTARADTPEDALCKLAIELFQQGILKRGMK